MTILYKKIPLALLGFGVLLNLSACKKKTTTTSDPTPAASQGTLLLHFHTNIDTNEVEDYGSVYVFNGTRKVSVTLAQLYVSGIQLIKTDGSAYSLEGVNLLKVMEVEEYMAGAVPAGNYTSIRFNVGLSPATNSSVPAAADSTLNRPDMWLGSSAQPSGFVFVNFQGKIDTSRQGNATVAQMQAFKYKIGTNGNLKTVTMPDQNFSVIPNQAAFVHITIDYSKLFNGLTLNNAANLMVNSATDNTSAIAAHIAANVPAMFRYEE